jgi:hypothetical protein
VFNRNSITRAENTNYKHIPAFEKAMPVIDLTSLKEVPGKYFPAV